MTDVSSAAAPAAATTHSGQTLGLPGWNPRDRGLAERERLIARARGSDAGRQLQRCFPRWMKAFDHLAWRALVALAANEPVDPNDTDVWESRDEQAQAVLRRHGLSTVKAGRLSIAAVRALLDGQAAADREAGLDWSRLTVPASRLDEPLRRAHARPPVDLSDPGVYARVDDQRRVLAGRLGLAGEKADDLSRWVLCYPEEFDPEDLRCWRIGSSSWLALADEQLDTVGRVERPVGLFVAPAIRTDGWQLTPVLSLEAIRLFTVLGGYVERDLCAATLPMGRVPALLERINVQTLHAGPKECLDCAGQLASELSSKLGRKVSPGVPRDKRDRWGRLLVSRTGYESDVGSTFELRLRVVTFPARDFGQRRLGARRMRESYNAQASAAMDLGEAVQAAVERGLPLLLSTEAAGHLKDTIRVGRMKGRPGALTITSSDGLSASTRRLVGEQAVAELRALKRAGAKVTLDAGAREMVRMTVARPLQDDPVLLGRQKEIAALKVVGSGVDASQVGSGKSVTSARALAQRASVQRRFRGLLVAEGRLLGQWRDELTKGAPGRGVPPLAPNVELLVLDDQRQVAGQLRAFDRGLGDRPGVVLCADGILDRYPADLQALRWHLLIADEALRYANPATGAHQALAQVRFGAAADCWLLTATPRGKSAEHLDVLVGLAVGDQAMITERLGTREAGDLLDELNAHRLRVNYGPHLVRITRQDMQRVDADGAARQAAGGRPRPGARGAARGDPQGRPGGLPAAARGAARAQTPGVRDRPVQAGARRALTRPGSGAGKRGHLSGRFGRSGDADALQGGAGAGARAPGPGADGDARRRRRAAAAARDRRADARRSVRRGAGAGVRRAGVVPAPARPHAAGAPRDRGARRRRARDGRRVRGAQGALQQRRIPDPVPVQDRAARPQSPGRRRAHAPRPAVGPERIGAARRTRRPARVTPRKRPDIYPLHPRRCDGARRLGAGAARR